MGLPYDPTNDDVWTMTLKDGKTYNIADAKARDDIERLIPGGSFGALAYKDRASGSYTPAGTINSALPSLSTTVDGERLILSFNAGSAPVFSGTQATITVS